MPMFEYTCQSCQSEFELLVRNGKSPACPDCGSEQLTKRFSVPAAHTSSSRLPVMSRTGGSGEGCGAPQCCMGRCQ